MKNLIVRALTGAVYVVLLVGCTVYGGVAALLFFSLVAAAATHEFGVNVNNHYGASVGTVRAALASGLLSGAAWLQAFHHPAATKLYALYGFTLLFMLVAELYMKAADPLKNWSLTFASQLYIAVPFALLPMLSQRGGDYTYIYILSRQPHERAAFREYMIC